TLTHPRLTLVSKDRAWHEIYCSRILLKNLLNEDVNIFSYPYGDYDKSIEDMVRKAGYLLACSSEFGNNSTKVDRFRLKRVLISRNGVTAKAELYLEANPWLAPIREGLYWCASTYPIEYIIRLTLPHGNRVRHIS
ncbi:MAG TPA: polysaccharide deacetylase family protein, partial [Firmicutes bacterium]|nr:polysaccharide deacetylase family protein [Bacillota bacterium]